MERRIAVDKIALAKELRRVAQILTSWGDDEEEDVEKGTLTFFINYTGDRSGAEKAKAKLDKYVGYMSGDYEFDTFMGTISVQAVRGKPGLIAMPVEFENKNKARKAMREVKHDPEAKRLGITVQMDEW